jgi:hypothetical protein
VEGDRALGKYTQRRVGGKYLGLPSYVSKMLYIIQAESMIILCLNVNLD